MHVVDAADAAWPSQLEVTRKVLAEIDVADTPALIVLNKADRLDETARAALRAEMPEALLMSAFSPADVSALRARIVAFFEGSMVEEDLFVCWRDQRMVHEIHESCRVLGEIHGETGTSLRVLAPRELIDQIRSGLREADQVDQADGQSQPNVPPVTSA